MESMSKEVHLFVLIHGLWGGPTHLAAAKEELVKGWKAHHGVATSSKTKIDTTHSDDPNVTTEVESGSSTRHRSRRLRGNDSSSSQLNGTSMSAKEGPEHNQNSFEPSVGGRANGSTHSGSGGEPDDLVVLIAGGMSSTLTYDGVDVNASRVAWEIDRKIEEIEESGRRVTKFSILGYSLGGLVARYLVGLLHSRTPSFFDKHNPVSFTTIATPHLGIPRYNTISSTLLVFLGSKLLARTGSQLYVTDKHSKDDPRPLLEIMADPRMVFYQALNSFSSLMIFANGCKDFTVPYPSAAIEPSDPFIEYKEQGLVTSVDGSSILSSWRYPTSEEIANKPEVKKKWKNPIDSLPPVLADRFRYNPSLLVLLPIAVPILMLIMIFRLSLDKRRSSNRIKQLVRPGNDSPTAIYSEHGTSIDDLHAAIKKMEQSIEADLMEEFDHDHQHHLLNQHINCLPQDAKHEHDGGLNSNGIDSEAVGPTSLQLPKTQIRFKQSQVKMVRWLNRLDWVKNTTWLVDIPNAHAAIVCRDPARHHYHEKGRGIVQRWVECAIDQ